MTAARATLDQVPPELLEEIALLVQGSEPRGLVQLSAASREMRRWVSHLLWRVVGIVQSTADVDWKYGVGIGAMRSLGFSAATADAFLSRPEQAAAARHLRIDVLAGTYERVLAACPRLHTLWIHGFAGRAALSALGQLRCLRELTIPFEYVAGRPDAVLPSVTHLFLVGGQPRAAPHARMLDSFPSVFRLGFSCEPARGSIERALASRDALGVLVHAAREGGPVDDRVVYLVQTSHVPFESEWMRRAAPHWTPWAHAEALWDHWTLYEAVIAARRERKLEVGTTVRNRVHESRRLFGLI